MIHIFYIFILFPIVWEIIVTSSPRKVSNFTREFKDLTMVHANQKQKTLANCMLGYLIWNLFGLLTGQWVLFVILLLLSLLPKNTLFLTFLNGFISLAILIFLVINQYHLHIDLYTVLFK